MVFVCLLVVCVFAAAAVLFRAFRLTIRKPLRTPIVRLENYWDVCVYFGRGRDGFLGIG